MKRRTLLITLPVFFIILLATLGFSGWIMGTTEGARMLLGAVSTFTPLEISADSISGSLLDELRFKEISIQWPLGDVRAESFILRWRPFYLLTGNAVFTEVSLNDLRITDRSPEEKPDLKWPEIAGLPARLDGRIDSLHVTGLSYRRGDNDPLRFNKISSTVLWSGGGLTLKDALIDAESFDAAGSAAAGFYKPFLFIDVVIVPSSPVRTMDSFSVKADLQTGQGPVHIKGPVSVFGRAGKDDKFSLSTEISLSRYSLTVEKILAKESGRKGELSGKSEIDFRADNPEITASLQIRELDISPEINIQTYLAGTVNLRGTPDDYTGDFNLSNSDESWRHAGFSGSFEGNKEGLLFLIKEGDWLGGSLTGSVGSSWVQGLSLHADIKARRLDPAVVTPEWHGVINFDMTGKMDWPGGGPAGGEVSGKIFDSTLRGRALTGEIMAGLPGDDLIIRKMFLRGNGFNINAKGSLREQLTFIADITDLSGLIPESQGQLYATGWVSIKDGFMGSAKAKGRSLITGDLSVEEANLNADIFTSEERHLNLKAHVKGLGYRTMLVDTADIEARGAMKRHDISISADFHKSGVRAKITGAYKEKSWDGKIVQLSGHDATDVWRLVNVAEVYVSREKIILSDFVLTGGNNERLAVKADIMYPLKGFVQSEWSQLNLERANQWLSDMRLSGNTSGSMRATWAKGRLTGINADIVSSGRFVTDRQSADIQKISASINWNVKGLLASFQGRFSENGIFEGGITSYDPVNFALPEQGLINGTWREVDLMILTPLLAEDMRVSGRTTGRMNAEWTDTDLQKISGMIEASGAFVISNQRVEVERTHLEIEWDAKNLSAIFHMEMIPRGTVNGEITASGPARMGLPDSGKINFHASNLDASVIRHWLPEAFDLEGKLSAQMNGIFLPDQRFDISGDAQISGGRVRYSTGETDLSAELSNAEISFIWREETLRGNLEIALADYGELSGDFLLPIDAGLPVDAKKDGKINISLKGKAQEKGLLTSFFPGFIQESHGRLEIDLRISGTWEDPAYAGGAELTEAGAYLPTTGISIKDVSAAAYFDGRKIDIGSFSAKSGKGSINGDAEIKMEKLRITEYRGNLRGKDFQAVYLPDLQVSVSPDLTFAGKPNSVSVKGEIKVPDLFISEAETELLKPSEDVIITDEPKKQETRLPAIDIAVSIVLGERAFVKMEGIDARIEGQVTVTARSPDAITGSGVIKVVKGAYRRYGIDLDIKRGQFIFAGGPVDDPSLDILAVREVGDVKAGVIVSGTPRLPVVKLYSDPSMTDTDILAYIVLGHPVGADQAQIGLLARAAVHLLSRGESATFQAKLQQRMGVDALDIEAGGGDVARSALTVGKYLSPRLYISYGVSLFTRGDVFRLKYILSRRWEIQTESGVETGIDIFYKIEFR